MGKYWYRISKSPDNMAHREWKMDMQLSVSKDADVESLSYFYEDVESLYDGNDISVIIEELNKTKPENIILTGFLQDQIETILPYIKDNVKILSLFKCKNLVSWDFLTECKKLEVVDIYINQKVTALWDIKQTPYLHTLVIDSCNKLNEFAPLKNSGITRLEIWGCNYLSSSTPKTKIDDLSIFQTMCNLEILRLAIMKNDNQEKDFEDLMQLTGLKTFRIQPRYFSAEKMKKLKEILPYETYE